MTKAANLKELESHFAFGENWAAYAEKIGTEQIDEAIKGLDRLAGARLHGKRFLDIGCGSGLHGLAALRLGAAEAVCVDIDPDSVATAKRVLARHAAGSVFRIEQASVFDMNAGTWGQFDVVYSWGVLHHTGAMWKAIDAALERVAPGGWLFIAIYNDQGLWSRRWTRIKRYYCSGPMGKAVVSATFIPYWIARGLAADIVWRRNPWKRYSEYSRARGMSPVRDWFDWLGGYPFEVAKPEDIILPLSKRGYRLTNLVTQGGSVGCVEYVFRHDPAHAGAS